MPSTQSSPYFEKDPNAVKDLGVDWTDWLVRRPGVTLSTVAVTTSAGLTIDSSSIDGNQGIARLSGGTIGAAYDVAFAGTFSNGEIDVQHIIVTVKEVPVGLP